MTVSLIAHMGSDLTVVNAARVSFDKESEWFNTGIRTETGDIDKVLAAKDKKLINYLAKHEHWLYLNTISFPSFLH